MAFEKGFRHSEETKAKMSATRKGRKRSPEECAAISRGVKMRYQKNPAKKFLALEETITKDKLFEEYVVNGKSTREIANGFGVSGATIKRYIHWYGIPMRPNVHSPDYKRKEDHYTFYQKMAYEVHGFERVCEMCGATEQIHVHHKDRNRANNAKDNIMILCVSCHAYLHWRHSTYNGVQFKLPYGEPKIHGDMS